MFEKLCELIGTNKSCENDLNFMYCSDENECLTFKSNVNNCNNCEFNLFPKLTAEKILSLEELVINKVGCINKGNDCEGYFYQTGFYEDFDIWGYDYISNGENYQNALCSLIIKLIEGNILTKEQVKEVVE